MSAISIAYSRKRILLLVVISTLLTGVLVGLSVALPLYNSMRSSLERVNAISAEALASALDNKLERLQDVAHQFTSRTEIRNRLQWYADGELSFDELVEYTRPRLGDAIEQVEDLAGLVRMGPSGEEVVRIGELPQWPDLGVVLEQGVVILETDTDLWLGVSASILGRQGEKIGTDLLLFTIDPLHELLVEFDRFGPDSTLCLYQGDSGLLLGVDPLSGQAVLAPPTRPDNLQRIDVTSAGLYHLRADQTLMAVFNAPLEHSDWSLLVRIPEQTLYSAAYKELRWAVLATLLMVLLVAWLTRRALGPMIQRLLKQAETIEQSTAELRLAASVFNGAQEAIVITDKRAAILRVNQAFTDITGYQEDAIRGRALTELVELARDEQNLPERIRAHLQVDNAWQGELWYRCENEQLLPTLQTISAVRDERGQVAHLIHIFNDISERKAAEHHMRRLAHHDALTGLPNRVSLLHYLQHAIDGHREDGQRFAVMFLDLDRFKPVNDTYGHQVGDQLLQHVAQRIRHVLRDQDVVGRFGGDEFLVVLERISQPKAAAVVAQKVIDTLSMPFVLEGLELNIGVSVGIAFYPDQGDDADAVIHAADAAMYAAKEAGRCCYRFHGQAQH